MVAQFPAGGSVAPWGNRRGVSASGIAVQLRPPPGHAAAAGHHTIPDLSHDNSPSAKPFDTYGDANFEVDWEQLEQVLPFDQHAQARDQRERLFKELCVRGEAAGAAMGKKSHKFRGTLTCAEVEQGLEIIFGKLGIVKTGLPEVKQAIHRAFQAARLWVDPVTTIDEDHVDMNQFHALVVYLAHDLDLQLYILQRRRCNAWNSDVIRVAEFEDFLNAISPENLLINKPRGAWVTVEEFANWRKKPAAALAELSMSPGSGVGANLEEMGPDISISMATFVSMCLQHVVSEIVTTSNFNTGNRKKAFQLLQALNNTPSLPNSVPGPLSTTSTPRTSVSVGSGFLGGARPPNAWATSHQRFFPPTSPRTPETLCIPAEAYGKALNTPRGRCEKPQKIGSPPGVPSNMHGAPAGARRVFVKAAEGALRPMTSNEFT